MCVFTLQPRRNAKLTSTTTCRVMPSAPSPLNGQNRINGILLSKLRLHELSSLTRYTLSRDFTTPNKLVLRLPFSIRNGLHELHYKIMSQVGSYGRLTTRPNHILELPFFTSKTTYLAQQRSDSISPMALGKAPPKPPPTGSPMEPSSSGETE
jgi:hypothetical protein